MVVNANHSGEGDEASHTQGVSPLQLWVEQEKKESILIAERICDQGSRPIRGAQARTPTGVLSQEGFPSTQ